MPPFANPSEPHQFGGPAYQSCHAVSPYNLTSYSANHFHDYQGTIRTISSPKPPTISNLTTQAATFTHASHAITPKTHTTELESPPQSANATSRPSLFATMESEIKSYISNKKDSFGGLQYKLSWEEFVAFRDEAKKSLPGWEKLNVDYQHNLKQLIIQCAGPGHEIMDDVFMQFWRTQTDSSAHKEASTNIFPMGTAEMDLQDGAGKQPDFSFVDDSPTLLNEERTFPTTIFEVAYSETSKRLAVDCGRFIACSVGRGQLAVAIDIKRDAKGDLSTVRFSKWELSSIEQIEWPPEHGSKYYGQPLDVLRRSDPGDPQVPATSFYCISPVGAGENLAHYVFHADQVDTHLIDSTNANPSSSLTILYRHMYREPERSKANDTLYDIPYALLMNIIRHHVEVDNRRKRAVKRKALPEGQHTLQAVVNKRIKKLIEAQTKVEPTASGSKPKTKPLRSKPESSK